MSSFSRRQEVPIPPTPSYPTQPTRTRTRALDIDTRGRRLGSTPLRENDHDENLTDKDVLPAYELGGRPPRYVEVAAPPELPELVLRFA